MRKHVIDTADFANVSRDSEWLDLEQLATVEVTSEDPMYPIEGALLPGTPRGEHGWRAAKPGEQTVRLIFDQPAHIRRIWLSIAEPEVERTQELVLRWSSDGGRSNKEIVRQQWNFSPGGSTREVEDYTVNLLGLTNLELVIVPDKSGGRAVASLAQLRLA